MKLYYSPGACSLCPHIIASELGIELDLQKTDLATKKLADGSDFRDINPLGYVPFLVTDNGLELSEVAVIAQYLADMRPEVGLAPPAGSDERYILMRWLSIVATEFHKGISPLFNKDLPEAAREMAALQLERRLGWLDKQLAGRDYVVGASFTIADAYLFTVLRWLPLVKIDRARWKNIDRYHDALRLRPSIVAAMAREGIRR
ncbi:MAG: glutathione transferase GstA [Deltaproteobacteria bacterium]|nr:glutathione transferase GstA [Deltaproteobacteria bacterium]